MLSLSLDCALVILAVPDIMKLISRLLLLYRTTRTLLAVIDCLTSLCMQKKSKSGVAVLTTLRHIYF